MEIKLVEIGIVCEGEEIAKSKKKEERGNAAL